MCIEYSLFLLQNVAKFNMHSIKCFIISRLYINSNSNTFENFTNWQFSFLLYTVSTISTQKLIWIISAHSVYQHFSSIQEIVGKKIK